MSKVLDFHSLGIWQQVTLKRGWQSQLPLIKGINMANIVCGLILGDSLIEYVFFCGIVVEHSWHLFLLCLGAPYTWKFINAMCFSLTGISK